MSSEDNNREVEVTTFETLQLDKSLLKAITEAGYLTPTEIQQKAIPFAIKGRDVFASAQTGTGKTAAFSLPILHQMIEKQSDNSDSAGKKHQKKKRLKALILSPTRELAQQIEVSLRDYGKHLPFSVITLVGGLPIHKQIEKLQKGIDIAVATPGRLLDLMKRREIDIRSVEYFVLDEADRMLDMGFIHDVKDIANKIPKTRQTLLFSATMTGAVKELTKNLLSNPEYIAAHVEKSVAKNIEECIYFVERKDKLPLLLDIIEREDIIKSLIFMKTKANANVLVKQLERKGLSVDVMHSDKSQKARQKALQMFENGEVQYLVATDVVARGIDLEDISHVINYELPTDPESYVHRIGRTARAGASGKAITLCDMHEASTLSAIEVFTEHSINYDDTHKYHSPLALTMSGKLKNKGGTGRNRLRRFKRRR